jgi:hypothetical protein
MASSFGKTRNMVCPGCGMPYDYHAQQQPHGFTIGASFLQARRDIIAIGTDRKTGKTKYGRRGGTLGFMHELKMMAWRAHVDGCVAAFDAAVEAGADPESLRQGNYEALVAASPKRPRKPRRRKAAEPARRAA